MVVERGHAEHAATVSGGVLRGLEDSDLKGHGEVLEVEEEAENGEEELLVDEDCADGDYASEGEGAGVAHEDCCGGGVVPEEPDEGADKGGHEDHELPGAGDIHYIKVGGVDDVASEVCHCHEGHSGDGREA